MVSVPRITRELALRSAPHFEQGAVLRAGDVPCSTMSLFEVFDAAEPDKVFDQVLVERIARTSSYRHGYTMARIAERSSDLADAVLRVLFSNQTHGTLQPASAGQGASQPGLDGSLGTAFGPAAFRQLGADSFRDILVLHDSDFLSERWGASALRILEDHAADCELLVVPVEGVLLVQQEAAFVDAAAQRCQEAQVDDLAEIILSEIQVDTLTRMGYRRFEGTHYFMRMLSWPAPMIPKDLAYATWRVPGWAAAS